MMLKEEHGQVEREGTVGGPDKNSGVIDAFQGSPPEPRRTPAETIGN